MAKKKREDFYKLLMYVVFSPLNKRVNTEVKSAESCADVVVKTKADIFILEPKADNALAQIDSTDYTIPQEADGRRGPKCGVSILSEARTIMHWRASDEEGEANDE